MFRIQNGGRMIFGIQKGGRTLLLDVGIQNGGRIRKNDLCVVALFASILNSKP
jgi:hypothetical protein